MVIYRIENGSEVEALRETKNGEHTLNYAPEIDFTEATSKLKVVVSDGREGKEAIGYVKCVCKYGCCHIECRQPASC